MDYQFLKKNGTFLGEVDIYDGVIYCGTEKFYLYNNILYVRKEPDNRMSYRGKTTTYILIDDVKEEIEQKNEMYFF